MKIYLYNIFIMEDRSYYVVKLWGKHSIRCALAKVDEILQSLK